MSGQTTMFAAAGTATAAALGGPLEQVFNELAIVLALMGALGGMTRGVAVRLGWLEVGRGVALGALLATGMGALLPQIVSPWIGSDLGQGATVPILAACAYLVGFAQDVLIARLRGGRV